MLQCVCVCVCVPFFERVVRSICIWHWFWGGLDWTWSRWMTPHLGLPRDIWKTQGGTGPCAPLHLRKLGSPNGWNGFVNLTLSSHTRAHTHTLEVFGSSRREVHCAPAARFPLGIYLSQCPFWFLNPQITVSKNAIPSKNNHTKLEKPHRGCLPPPAIQLSVYIHGGMDLCNVLYIVNAFKDLNIRAQWPWLLTSGHQILITPSMSPGGHLVLI